MTYRFEDDTDWSIIRSGGALEVFCRELADQQFFAWDVETTGVAVWRSRVIGHAFAFRRPNKQMRAAYIPMRHVDPRMDFFSDYVQLPPEIVTSAVKPILEGAALKAGHNLKFDILVSRHDEINACKPICDTMVASRLADENLRSYKLEMCLSRFHVSHEQGWKASLDKPLAALAKYAGQSKKAYLAQHGYSQVDVPTLGRYAAQDAAYEYKLAEALLPLQRQWADIWAMEMRLFWVCLGMEVVGVPVDRQCLENLAAECQGTMNEIAPKIWKLAGEEFDVSNDGTIRRVLYEKLKAPVVGMTEKEMPAVDDDALWMLEKQGWEIAKLIREWNAPQKILTTYTTSIVELTDAHGILHAQIDQGGARTGRVSSRQPNLQNIPIRSKLGRRVREAFVARPGMVRYCLDYGQIELRILAHLSQDPLLLKIYREGLDAHSATAIEVFGTDGKIDGIDMRRTGKILNFGTAFGMTHIGLMRNVNKDLPEGQPPIDEARATRFREQFYQKYAGITLFQQRLWERIRRSGGRFQNLFGRPRRMPGILSKNRREMAAAERGSVASLVQGSAADLVKYSMCAVADYLDAGQAACECSMVLMIHDDLQFDMAFEGSAKTVRDIHRLMEQTCQGRISVPIVADVEYFTTNWAEKKKMKL